MTARCPLRTLPPVLCQNGSSELGGPKADGGGSSLDPTASLHQKALMNQPLRFIGIAITWVGVAVCFVFLVRSGGDKTIEKICSWFGSDDVMLAIGMVGVLISTFIGLRAMKNRSGST